jgi:hypothetical protein
VEAAPLTLVGCTVCDSAAGRQTRAAVRDGLAADAAAVGLPLLALAAAALVVRFAPLVRPPEPPCAPTPVR